VATLYAWHTRPTSQPIVSWGLASSSPFVLELDPAGKLLTVSGSGAVVTTAVPVVSFGKWTHVAFVHDGTSTATVYANGVVQANLTALTYATDPSSVSAPLVLGSDASFSGFYAGVLDEVRVYARALTASEVADLAVVRLPSFPNASNPTAALGVSRYAWYCLPGFSSPAPLPSVMTQDPVDGSWIFSGGAVTCLECPSGHYSFNGVSACAPCPPGLDVRSDRGGCVAPSPGPTDAVFYFSADASETTAAFTVQSPAGLSYVRDVVSGAGSALSLEGNGTSLAAFVPSLPSGNGARSVAMWVQVPQPSVSRGPPPISGMWAYYPFSSSAADASGNGRDGILGGGAVVTAGGLRCVTSSDIMTIPALTTSSLTMSVAYTWDPTVTTSASWATVVGWTGGDFLHLVIDVAQRALGLYSWGLRDSGYRIVPGRLTIITLVITSSSFSLYVDGALVQTSSMSYSGTMPPTTVCGDPFGQPARGLLDDVVLFDRALSAAEVATLYAWHTRPTSRPLLSWGLSTSSPFVLELDSAGKLLTVSGSGAVVTTAVPVVSFGKWTHVAFVHDGTSTATVYANGVVQANLTALTYATDPSSVSAPLVLGSDASFSGFYAGVLDEVRVYARALTASEVADLAVVRHPCPPSAVPSNATTTGSRCQCNSSSFLPTYNSTTGELESCTPCSLFGVEGGHFSPAFGACVCPDGTTLVGTVCMAETESPSLPPLVFRLPGPLAVDPYSPVSVSGLALPSGTSDRTLVAWVRVERAGNVNFWPGAPANFIASWGDVYYCNALFALSINVMSNLAIDTLYGWTACGDIGFDAPPGSLEIGAWMHVGFLVRAGIIELYLEGAIVATRNVSFDTPVDDTLYIGHLSPSDPAGTSFPGSLFDLRVYASALVPAELQGLRQEGLLTLSNISRSNSTNDTTTTPTTNDCPYSAAPNATTGRCECNSSSLLPAYDYRTGQLESCTPCFLFGVEGGLFSPALGVCVCPDGTTLIGTSCMATPSPSPVASHPQAILTHPALLSRPGPVAIVPGPAQTLLVADAPAATANSSRNATLVRVRPGPHYDLADDLASLPALPAPLLGLAVVGNGGNGAGLILGVDGGASIVSIADPPPAAGGTPLLPLVVQRWGTLQRDSAFIPAPSPSPTPSPPAAPDLSLGPCKPGNYSFGGSDLCAPCPPNQVVRPSRDGCLPPSAPIDAAWTLSGSLAEGLGAYVPSSGSPSPTFVAGMDGAPSSALFLPAGANFTARGLRGSLATGNQPWSVVARVGIPSGLSAPNSSCTSPLLSWGLNSSEVFNVGLVGGRPVPRLGAFVTSGDDRRVLRMPPSSSPPGRLQPLSIVDLDNNPYHSINECSVCLPPAIIIDYSNDACGDCIWNPRERADYRFLVTFAGAAPLIDTIRATLPNDFVHTPYGVELYTGVGGTRLSATAVFSFSDGFNGRSTYTATVQPHVPRSSYLVVFPGPPNSNNQGMVYRLEFFSAEAANCTTAVAAAAAAAPASLAWSSLALTFDGNATRSYVNGMLVSSIPASFATQDDDMLVLGGSASLGDLVSSVAVSDMRVYNRTLTGPEVAALAFSGGAPSSTNTNSSLSSMNTTRLLSTSWTASSSSRPLVASGFEGWTALGSAFVAGDSSRSAVLTTSGVQAGAVWAPYYVSLLHPFTVSVTMTVTDEVSGGADGWNLLLQSDSRKRSALGGGGGGVGMAGSECSGWCPPITPYASLLVKDGWMTHAWRGSLSSSSRPLVYYGGDDFMLSTSIPLGVVLSYDPAARRLSASTSSGMKLSLDIDLVAELGVNSAVVGLTAGTGAGGWRHTASSFSFSGSTTADEGSAFDPSSSESSSPFSAVPRLVSIAAGPVASMNGGRPVYVLDAANSCVWAVLASADGLLLPSSRFYRVTGSIGDDDGSGSTNNSYNASLVCASDPAMASSPCGPMGEAGGPATGALLLRPTSIAVSGDGARLFVTERGRIRVLMGAAPVGLIGDDVPIIFDFAGNGVPANASVPPPHLNRFESPMTPTHLAYDDGTGTLCFMSAGWLWCAHEGLNAVARIPFPTPLGGGREAAAAAQASSSDDDEETDLFVASDDAADNDASSPWPAVVGGLAFAVNGSLRVSDTEGRRVLAVPASTIALALNPPRVHPSTAPQGLGGVDSLQIPFRFVRITAPAGSPALSFAELELFAADDGENVAALGAASTSMTDAGQDESASSSVDSDVILPGCADLPEAANTTNASLAIDNDVACTYVLVQSPAPWWEVSLKTFAWAPRSLAVLRLTPLPLGQSVGLGGANVSFINAERGVVASLSLPASVAAGQGGAFTVDLRCLLRMYPTWNSACANSAPHRPTGRHFTVYANAADAVGSQRQNGGLAVGDGHERRSLEGGTGGRLHTGADLADGEWRHVVVVYASTNTSYAGDRRPAALAVYVDGEVVANSSSASGSPLLGTDSVPGLLVFGDSLPGVRPAPLAAGSALDDMRVYAGELDEGHVRSLYAQGREGESGGEEGEAGAPAALDTRPSPLSPDFEEDRPFPTRAGEAFASFYSPCPGGVSRCAVPVLSPAQRPSPSLRVPSDVLLRRRRNIVSEIATTSVADESLPFDVDARETWLGLDGLAVAGLCAGPNAFFAPDLAGGLPPCGPLASVEVWGETVASLLPEDVAGSGSLRSDVDRTAFVGFADGAAVNAQATLQSEPWDVGNVSTRLSGVERGAANVSATLSSSAAAAVGLRLSAVVWGLFIDVSGARLAWPYDCALGDTWECPSSAFLSQDAVGNVLGAPVRILADLFGTAGGSVSGTPLSASVLARVADGTLLEDAREAVRASPLLSRAWAEVERAAAGGRRLKGEAARARSLGLSASASVSGLASLAVDAAAALDSAVDYLAAALAESDVPSTLRRMRVTGVRAEAKVEVGTRRFGESFAEFLFPGGALESATVVLGSQSLPTGEEGEEPLARHLACSLRPDGEHPVPAIVEATLALLDVDGDGGSSLSTTFLVHLGRLVEWLDGVAASLLRDTLALPVPSLSLSRYWSGGWSAPVSTVLRIALDYGLPRYVPCGPAYGPTFGPARFAGVYGCEATRVAVSPPLSGYWLRPRFAGAGGMKKAHESVVTGDHGVMRKFWETEMQDLSVGPLASELSGYGPGQYESGFVLWGKVVPFDSNDAAACGGEFCSAVPAYCGDGGGGKGGGGGPAPPPPPPPPPSPSPTPPPSPREELDMRVLPGDYPGNPYGVDVVLASRAACGVLSARGSDVRCRGGAGSEIVVGAEVFVLVAPASELGMASADSCAGGGDGALPSAAPSATPSATPAPSDAASSSTPTPTPSDSPTPTNTPTPSETPSATATPSGSPSNTQSPSCSPTASETPTPSSTPSNSPTPSPSASDTPSPSSTPTGTPTPAPSPSAPPLSLVTFPSTGGTAGV
jgi:hypothetical protein